MGGLSRRMPQIVIGLAVTFLALLLLMSVLPEPQPEAQAPPAPTSTPPPTNTAMPTAHPSTTPRRRPAQQPTLTPEPAPPWPSKTATKDGLETALYIDDADLQLFDGQIVRAVLSVTNKGQETIELAHQWLTLMDQQGEEVYSWFGPLPAGYEGRGLPVEGHDLRPGEQISITSYKIMPQRREAGSYDLWGTLYYTKQGEEQQRQLQVGSFPIQVQLPPLDQALQTDISFTTEGWTLRVTGSDGAALEQPAQAVFSLWTTSRIGYYSGQHQSQDGTITGRWVEFPFQELNEQPVKLEGIITAPGHVPLQIAEDIDIFADEKRGQPERETGFETLEGAEQAYGHVALRIPEGTQGLRFDDAIITTAETEEEHMQRRERSQLKQRYSVDGAVDLVLVQDEYEWTTALYTDYYQAVPIAVNGTEGFFLSQHYGWWVVGWQHGDKQQRVELRARQASFSREQVLELVTLLAG